LMSLFTLEQRTSFKGIVLASLSGICSHILLDSPLYSDIRPFYPIESNPLQSLNMFTGFGIYAFCILSFTAAGIVYAARLVFRKKS